MQWCWQPSSATFAREDGSWLGINGSPSTCAGMRRIAETAGRSRDDRLYYQHRVDANVPIEDNRRLHGGTESRRQRSASRLVGGERCDDPPSARSARDYCAADGVLAVVARSGERPARGSRELGIGFVATVRSAAGFSPPLRSIDDLEANDWRRNNPRFQADNFQRNLDIVERVKRSGRAETLHAGAARACWLLAQAMTSCPSQVAKRRERLEENAARFDIELTGMSYRRSNTLLPAGMAAGTRYPNGDARRQPVRTSSTVAR
jgi:aryl-alcohol dehydrogenase-like predicted oxidoreductase